jgi:hypothetical protein
MMIAFFVKQDWHGVILIRYLGLGVQTNDSLLQSLGRCLRGHTQAHDTYMKMNRMVNVGLFHLFVGHNFISL